MPRAQARGLGAHGLTSLSHFPELAVNGFPRHEANQPADVWRERRLYTRWKLTPSLSLRLPYSWINTLSLRHRPHTHLLQSTASYGRARRRIVPWAHWEELWHAQTVDGPGWAPLVRLRRHPTISEWLDAFGNPPFTARPLWAGGRHCSVW